MNSTGIDLSDYASRYQVGQKPPSLTPGTQLYKFRRNMQQQRREEREAALRELWEDARQQFVDEWAQRSRDLQDAIANRMPPAGYRRGGSLVAQLSDLHFGSIVYDDLGEVKYNYSIAAKRLQMYAERVKDLQAATGASKLYIAITGDLVESRMGRNRLDKVTNYDGAQSLAMSVGLSLIIQFIEDLWGTGQFDSLNIHGITGNEARTTPEVTFGRSTVPENFDAILNGLISQHFDKRPNVNLGFGPVSYVMPIEDLKVLLIHGHTITNQLTQQNTNTVLANYGCDFGMSGHIHFPLTQGNWSRSASLVGECDYSKNALNLKGRASQTVLHVAGTNRSPYQIDLDDPGEIVGYEVPNHYGAFGSLEMQQTTHAA